MTSHDNSTADFKVGIKSFTDELATNQFKSDEVIFASSKVSLCLIYKFASLECY